VVGQGEAGGVARVNRAENTRADVCNKRKKIIPASLRVGAVTAQCPRNVLGVAGMGDS
jgi:hypothetical protein